MTPPVSTCDPPRPAAAILVADDNAVIRVVCKSTLERNGFTCLLADNGQQALTAIFNDHPSAVVLDVQMPVMDGLEVLREMRSSEKTRDIPVLLLSGCRDVANIAVAIRLGNDYMAKPFKPEELVVRLHRLLADRKMAL